MSYLRENFFYLRRINILYMPFMSYRQDKFLNIRHRKFQYAKSLEIQENTRINRALLEPLFLLVFKKSGLYLAIPFIATQNTGQNTGQKYTKSKTVERVLEISNSPSFWSPRSDHLRHLSPI